VVELKTMKTKQKKTNFPENGNQVAVRILRGAMGCDPSTIRFGWLEYTSF
jgi:hypothetical protein